MISYIVNINSIKHFRVTKTVALKKYLNGQEIIVVPCNMIPSTKRCNYSTISNPNGVADREDFEKVLNAIRYYNCNNEAGRYLSYYIRSEE